jgi:hypothetical protein
MAQGALMSYTQNRRNGDPSLPVDPEDAAGGVAERGRAVAQGQPDAVEDNGQGRITGVSKEKYAQLPKRTPSQEVRDSVNPEGTKVDPVYGYSVERLEADHIASRKSITEMDGFNQLTTDQQVEVLNLSDIDSTVKSPSI